MPPQRYAEVRYDLMRIRSDIETDTWGTLETVLSAAETGEYHHAALNSDSAESWHSWSSNSRWIVFSSKRQGGVFTRPFLSYVDPNGETHKPFVLPQRDPAFYRSCYDVCSVPELIVKPVTVDHEVLVQAITGPAQIAVNSVTGATAKAGSADTYAEGQPSVQ